MTIARAAIGIAFLVVTDFVQPVSVQAGPKDYSVVDGKPLRRWSTNQRIGSWLTAEGLILNDGRTPWSNAIILGSDSRPPRTIKLQCTANHYEVQSLACEHESCDYSDGPVDVRIDLYPSKYGFNVAGVAEYHGGIVTAPLTNEQVAEMTQIEWTAIGVGAHGRPYIKAETSGTAAAMASLASVCNPDGTPQVLAPALTAERKAFLNGLAGIGIHP
jgi:hypothetical protein